MTMSVFANRDIRCRRIQIYAEMRTPGAPSKWAELSEFRERRDDEYEAPVALSLTYEDATKLMDELWNARVRPSDQFSTDNERKAMEVTIAALKSEVEFLRTIVRHHLGIVT